MRARSASLSTAVTVPSGPSTTWSMPAAIRSPLTRVQWISPARRSWCPWSSLTSAPRSARAARGSSSVGSGTGSFATSSDWTTIRAGAPSASTSYKIAATERCTNDTRRVERTRTLCSAGELHSTSRRSTPARRSSTRSWCTSEPYRTSNGSSSTSSRMILPLVTLISVWPSSGSP
jgi:hypothetical protein